MRWALCLRRSGAGRGTIAAVRASGQSGQRDGLTLARSASISAARGSACSPPMRAGGPDRSRPAAPALPGSPRSSAGSGGDGRWRERTSTSSSWPRAACGRARSARVRRGGSGPSRAMCGSSRTRRPPIAAPSAMRPACSSSPAPARWRSGATAAGAGRAPADSDRSWATRARRSGSDANGSAPRPEPEASSRRGASSARPTPSRESPRVRPPSCAAPAPGRHPSARAIVTRAQAALADLLVTTARRLRLRPPIAVSWSGSLLDVADYRAGVWRAARQRGLVLTPRPPRESAVQAALGLARARRSRPADSD